MNGKGSKPRPLSISKKEFDAKMDKIFGKKDEEKNITGIIDTEYKSIGGWDINTVKPLIINKK